jgi:uncharacterized protein YggE
MDGGRYLPPRAVAAQTGRVAVNDARRVGFGMLLAALLSAAGARAEGPTGPGELRLVAAVGRAQTEVVPDRALVLLTVRANGKTAGEAARAAAARSAQILEALRGKLGPGDRAETAGTSLQPVTVYEQGKAPRVTGFAAEHTLRARSARIQEVGALLDAVTSSADVSVDSVRFELADPGPAQANALKLAARDARTRAAAMAEGLGLSLGPVHTVRELGAAPSPTPAGQFRMKAMAADASPPTQVLPPALEIDGEVEVSFELASGPRP